MNWIFYLILMTSIWVIGLTVVTQQGMLLFGIRKWANFHSQEKPVSVYDAIIKCPFCMPSIHSAIGYGFCILSGIVELDIKLLYVYPVVVCGSSFISGFLWTVYELILSYSEKLEVEQKHLNNIEQLSYFDVTDRKKQFQAGRNQSITKKSLNHER